MDLEQTSETSQTSTAAGHIAQNVLALTTRLYVRVGTSVTVVADLVFIQAFQDSILYIRTFYMLFTLSLYEWFLGMSLKIGHDTSFLLLFTALLFRVM